MIDVNQDVVTEHFSRMMKELGLTNMFELCHDKNTIPATHHRGRRPISAIYIHQNMKCVQCGILSKTFGVHGDQRNMFADISVQTLIGAPMYDVETQPMKKLQLKDSRIVDKFVFHMRKHINKPNLLQKAQLLYDKAVYPCTKETSIDRPHYDI